jgi:hypothetical protein
MHKFSPPLAANTIVEAEITEQRELKENYDTVGERSLNYKYEIIM